ncbi:MAG: hypothetical protein V1811_00840 [Candidatus Micrarchaeota archaeon]
MLELVSTAIQTATLILSPIIILFVIVVAVSGRSLTPRGKRFLAACVLLGLSQTLTALGNAYSNGYVVVLGQACFLAGLILLFVILEIRSRGHLHGEKGD